MLSKVKKILTAQLPFAFGALAIWIAIFWLLTFLRGGHEARFLEEQSQIQALAWRAATQMNEGMVELYFHHYVMKDETTLALLKKAQDPATRDAARRALFEHLNEVNKALLARGFRQFHFHLPNGDSLLRFHHPERFGDNLLAVRYSIRTANEQLQTVFGFEAGRIYSGFRAVFPIITPQGEHLGSVELSMPFEALRTKIAHLMPEWEFIFVVSGEQHDRILFDSRRDLYRPWPLHRDFWLEDPDRTLEDSAAALSGPMSCLLEEFMDHPKLNPLIDQRLSGALSLPLGESYGVLALTAVDDIQGQNAGYLVGLTRSDEPAFLDTSVQIGLLISGVLLALLALTIGWLNHNRKELKRAKHELERALAAEQQFIASMSHEMRTPLNSIIGYQDLLLGQPLDQDSRRFVQRANHSAEHLLALISDILDLSKLHAGKLELTHKPIALDGLLQECLEIITPNLRADVKLTLDREPLPCELLGDEMRLRQILLNLLSNAAKFTHHGQIRLCSAISGDKKEGFTLVLSVQDTGVGIDPKRLDGLFAPFKRAHNQSYEGSGLGLFISRNLAEEMGGTLVAKSHPDEGSTFTLTLPLSGPKDAKISFAKGVE